MLVRNATETSPRFCLRYTGHHPGSLFFVLVSFVLSVQKHTLVKGQDKSNLASVVVSSQFFRGTVSRSSAA
jgi:hypothetical protein